jgi:hypothetical protein
VLLAQVTMTSGHAEQIDVKALQSDIDEVAAESHGGDEVESIAIQIPILLAKGKADAAQQSLIQAQGVSNASWLSKYHLMVASAQIDASQGKALQSRRKIEAARAQAIKVGCRACDLEPTSSASKGAARRVAGSASEISLDTPSCSTYRKIKLSLSGSIIIRGYRPSQICWPRRYFKSVTHRKVERLARNL